MGWPPIGSILGYIYMCIGCMGCMGCTGCIGCIGSICIGCTCIGCPCVMPRGHVQVGRMRIRYINMVHMWCPGMVHRVHRVHKVRVHMVHRMHRVYVHRVHRVHVPKVHVHMVHRVHRVHVHMVHEIHRVHMHRACVRDTTRAVTPARAARHRVAPGHHIGLCGAKWNELLAALD